MSFIRAACRHGLVLAAALAAALGLPGRAAQAQIGSDRYAAIVVDARTGGTLFAANADEARHPASLTKMMTLYMVFEALRDGRLSLSTPLTVSADAASRPPSKLGLAPGSSITVEQAILALVTKSANDAAAVLGEHLGGGSEARFAQMMTLRARALGMTRTTFRNASGLPDPDQVTTARDMALLGRRLMHDFPDRFAYFSTPAFAFRGRTLWNHNRLLQEYEGTDGIKTGYVHDSGFNLVASAQRDGVRLIAAVFGGASGRERDRHVMALLDQGFERMGVAPRERGSNSV
ncbi:D-alanyl-D-alanine carboxypeptidase family protein, partial [Caldovatus aquaticus]